MDRCPHCATPNASRPVCRVCGAAFDSPAAQPVLADLEPTLRAAVAVSAPRLPGLETTEEVLGDVSIPVYEAPAEGPARCPCGVPNPPAATRCRACGQRLGT